MPCSCHSHPWFYVDSILVINMGYRLCMVQCLTLKSVVNVSGDVLLLMLGPGMKHRLAVQYGSLAFPGRMSTSPPRWAGGLTPANVWLLPVGIPGEFNHTLLLSLEGVEHGPWLRCYHQGLQRKPAKVACLHLG